MPVRAQEGELVRVQVLRLELVLRLVAAWQIEIVIHIERERNALAVDEPLDIDARYDCNYNNERPGHPFRSLYRRR